MAKILTATADLLFKPLSQKEKNTFNKLGVNASVYVALQTISQEKNVNVNDKMGFTGKKGHKKTKPTENAGVSTQRGEDKADGMLSWVFMSSILSTLCF